jgi:Fe-S-cluster containining protein
MSITHVLQRYELLVAKADQAFQKMKKEFPECIKCKPRCSDCCHALFGLFLIEAVYLKRHFDKLGRKARRAALLRGNKADKELKKLEERLQKNGKTPEIGTASLARERIRCPLLDDHQVCTLYFHRPITCRVYGIPTAIQGKARVCRKAGFKSGTTYPLFDLDRAYQELYLLSGELLKEAGRRDPERASLLISVSRVIKTPPAELV